MHDGCVCMCRKNKLQNLVYCILPAIYSASWMPLDPKAYFELEDLIDKSFSGLIYLQECED